MTSTADGTWHDHLPPYLSPDDTDGVARMVIALAREVWVLRDRLTMAEALLEGKGVIDRTEIDRFVPDDVLANELVVESDAFMERVMGAPISSPQPMDDVVSDAARWTQATRARQDAVPF